MGFAGGLLQVKGKVSCFVEFKNCQVTMPSLNI